MTGITATRDDAGFFGSMFAAKPTVIDPTALVNKALAGFQEASDNLVAAQGIIAKQKDEHEVMLFELAAKVAECGEQHSRLARIRERLADLVA